MAEETKITIDIARSRERRAYARVLGMGYLMNFDGQCHPAFIEACVELLEQTCSDAEKCDDGRLEFAVEAITTEDDDGLSLPYDRARVHLGMWSYFVDGHARMDLAVATFLATENVVCKWRDDAGVEQSKLLLNEVRDHIEDHPYYLTQGKALSAKLTEHLGK